MVSAYIYDETDWKLAQTCYTTLYNAGLTIRRAPKYYAFSHNKVRVSRRRSAGQKAYIACVCSGADLRERLRADLDSPRGR
jgi:hypothetical protein